MPTYQYRCRACGDELEAFQKFTDPALTECPSCEGELRKVFGAVGVVFKGSGFYATDSRKATSASSPADAKPGSSTDSKPGAGSESKPSSSSTDAPSSAASTPAAATA